MACYLYFCICLNYFPHPWPRLELRDKNLGKKFIGLSSFLSVLIYNYLKLIFKFNEKNPSWILDFSDLQYFFLYLCKIKEYRLTNYFWLKVIYINISKNSFQINIKRINFVFCFHLNIMIVYCSTLNFFYYIVLLEEKPKKSEYKWKCLSLIDNVKTIYFHPISSTMSASTATLF